MTPPSSPRAGEPAKVLAAMKPEDDWSDKFYAALTALWRVVKGTEIPAMGTAPHVVMAQLIEDVAWSGRAGEAALDRLRLELNVYDAMPVHEYTEETIRSAEGRIIIAAREVARRAGEAEGGVRPDDDAVWAHVIREHETGEPALLDDEGVAAVNKALSVYGSRTFLDRTWIRPGPTLAALASPEPAGDEK
jgi:hypothetical protein